MPPIKINADVHTSENRSVPPLVSAINLGTTSVLLSHYTQAVVWQFFELPVMTVIMLKVRNSFPQSCLLCFNCLGWFQMDVSQLEPGVLFRLVDQLMTRNSEVWLWTLLRTGPSRGLRLVDNWFHGKNNCTDHFAVVANMYHILRLVVVVVVVSEPLVDDQEEHVVGFAVKLKLLH